MDPTAEAPRLTSLFDYVEKASKLTAMTLFLVSASGYLIISLHQARFGVLQTNPFRPRVLSAGVLYAVLIAIPLLIATPHRRQLSDKSKSIWQIPFLLWITCYSVVFVPYSFFRYSEFASFDRKTWIVISVSATAVLLTILQRIFFKSIPNWIIALVEGIAVACFLGIIYWQTMILKQFTRGSLALWLFGIAALYILSTETNFSWALSFQMQGVTNPILVTLISIIVFSTQLYPHIDSSWGGGLPVPVVIYFTQASPILQQKSASVLLLDETDTGYYVMTINDQKATFIPRAEVSLVHFGSDIKDSELFKAH